MSKSGTSQWPPVYPASMVERYRQLYGRRRDELLSLVTPMGAAYDRIIESGQLSETDLQVIIDAAACERLLVSMNAVELLQSLSAKWPNRISRSVTDLFSSAKAHARFAAICVLTKNSLHEVVHDVLKRGLKDKSARVRWKAADRAERLERRDLLPDVELALASEKDAKTRREIDHHLRMMRDGYIRRDEADGSIFLWVRTPQSCSGQNAEAEVVEEKGIEAVVADVRKGAMGRL